jgi:F0F1-type ATP synthase delta subunit
MADEKQLCDLAKSLVEISLQGDEVSADRVGGVLRALAANPPRNYKPILRLFKKYVEREIASYTAIVEHAGPLSNNIINSVKKFLEKDIGRSINVQTQEAPELIAGLRVTIGDDVYEDSLDFRLSPLAETIL